VIRSDVPSGAADSENGCAVPQAPRARNRQRKNCPAWARRLSTFRRHLRDPQPVAESARERDEHPPDHEDGDRHQVERPPVVRGDAAQHELVAGRDLVEPGQRDACIRQHVHRVPPLVAQPATHDHDRGADHREQHPRADGRRDHARVDAAAEHRRDLAADADLVDERVPPDREHDVRDDQIDADMPVPAVPDREAIESHEALERR
jgi:hypothetical protein